MPVDCAVSAYEVKAPDRCSVPACGGGSVTARATVLTPAQGGGKACPSLELVQKCNTAPCPAVLESGMRWRVVSTDPFESFLWASFRAKLAYYAALDENRFLLVANTSGSTIVDFTLLDADGDPARNHVRRLAALAGDATSGLNVRESSETVSPGVTTAQMQQTTAPTSLSEETVTIIAAVVSVVGGLLLIGGIVACVVVARKKKQKRAQADLPLTDQKNALYDLEEIGEGAFGKVYKANRNHEHVAVKTVNNEAYGSDTDIRREVALLQKLKPHTNVVSYRGFATVKGRPALVLEFCDGGALWAALEDASDDEWPTERQLKVASGIAAGVAYLHDNGIVHRDLAARNVLLTDQSVARVTDFGMSIASAARDASKTSSAFGATAWMAPEQLSKDETGQYSFSTKSDVYSFGVVMFELFERKVPWSECKSHAEIVKALEDGKTLRVNDRKYPHGVLSIVKLCWSAAKKRPDMETVAGLLGESHGVEKNSNRFPDPTAGETEKTSEGSSDPAALYPADDVEPHPGSSKKSGKSTKPYFTNAHSVDN
jgi:hypothetical protein